MAHLPGIAAALLRHCRRFKVLALVATALAVSQAAPEAGVYRWVDEHGKVYYGDRPPSKAESTSIVIEAAPEPAPGDSNRRAKTQRLLDAIESEREREQAQAAQAKADKLRQERNCQAARRRVEFYERANSLFRKGDDGERVYLSDADRTRVLSHARTLVSKWCK